ncbi:MAG TPA: HIT family protein [Anaerolineae bacterium]|nr:HIT family protein [Anaerolineae bacterium]
MTARAESDEKYLLDIVARILAEPDYSWQHRFPALLGDPGRDGKPRTLPVDGYFPRHRLIVEYWERQHSAPVGIMDEGESVSGVSRGHQRRLYDARRQAFADAHGLRLVILDYRGFETGHQGRLRRDPARDEAIVAEALRFAGALDEPAREPVDMARYVEEARQGCFICRLAQADPSLPPHQVVWRDSHAIAFLDRFPAAFGHTLVAPVRHAEQVTGEFTLNDYLSLQRVVHAVAEAVRLALMPERVYVLSLGSQSLNAHVHWHIVPCPPGLPLEEQQTVLLERRSGAVRLSPEEGEALARRLRERLPAWMRERATGVS